VTIKEREHLGCGIVINTKSTQGGVIAHVEFPRRDYTSWFLVDLLERVSAVDMLGMLGSDAKPCSPR